jgi:hypothetical protein
MTKQPSEADAALDRLIARFGERVPVGSIIETFAQAVRGLQMAGVDAGVIVAAEAMARNRLASRLSAPAVASGYKTA